MRSVKINKIAAACLLMVVGLSIMVAQGLTCTRQEIPPDRTIQEKFVTSIGAQISIPAMPRVGEVFEATFTVSCKNDLEKIRFGPNYVVFFTSNVASIIAGKEQKFSGYMKKGEIKQYKAKMIIREPSPTVSIGGHISAPVWGPQGISFVLFLVNEKTGQYGTKEEWLNTAISVFWKYNNVEPQWLSEPDRAWEPSNRKIAQEMRKFEPALTDSEALCLHEDNYKLIINAIGDSNATDEERIEYLLEAGWLDAQRSGAEAKENWFNDFMEKNHGRWGGNSNLNFFRDSNSSDSDYLGSNNPPKDRITTTFIGTWVYNENFKL